MPRTYIKDIKQGKEVELWGWIHEIRDLAKIKFILLRDATGIIQCITKDKKLFKKISSLSLESVIKIKGKAKSAKVKYENALHNIEVEIKSIEIINKAAQELPIQINEKGISTGLDKRLDFRCLDLRKLKNKAIFKIEAVLIEGMQNWLNKNGFMQVFTPCLIAGSSESGAEVFSVSYYNKKAFLRQDPQLHRQLTVAGGFEKIYDIGTSWRAEKSHTIKHLTEHRTCAVELAFIKDEQDTMRIQEQVIIAGLKNIKEKCKKELEILKIKLQIPKAPFPELKFPEIYKILEKLGKKITKGRDLDSESEKLLAEYVKKKYKTDFFFVNGFPFKIKPFYVYHNSQYARSVDLYGKDIELSSGGQREYRYEILMKNIKEKKLAAKNLEWFTKFFKFGVPSHGGFAIGIERLIEVILNLQNIREACLFPRDTERLEP